jgi:hypothetical protein
MKKTILATLITSMLVSALHANKEDESWIYLDNGTLRIGIDKARGAAIGHLSLSKDKRNLLNHFDEGRFIQQSYYGAADGSLWAGKPWTYNPVQGGSYEGKSAKTLDYKQEANSLYAKIEPLHWATGVACPEATMEEWISLEGNVAKIRMRMHYTGVTHEGKRHQEMPAMFVDYALPFLYFEKENKLVKHEPIILGDSLSPEIITYETEWLAFVDEKNFGIGIYTPETKEAVTYRAKGDGTAGPGGSACSYVAPVRTLSLTQGTVIDYEFYLCIGSLDEIRASFSKLKK